MSAGSEELLTWHETCYPLSYAATIRAMRASALSSRVLVMLLMKSLCRFHFWKTRYLVYTSDALSSSGYSLTRNRANRVCLGAYGMQTLDPGCQPTLPQWVVASPGVEGEGVEGEPTPRAEERAEGEPTPRAGWERGPSMGPGGFVYMPIPVCGSFTDCFVNGWSPMLNTIHSTG